MCHTKHLHYMYLFEGKVEIFFIKVNLKTRSAMHSVYGYKQGTNRLELRKGSKE